MPVGAFMEGVVALLLDALRPQRKAMRALRARWGKPGDKDVWLASEYFDLTRDETATACIDDKTWTDLELPKLFASLDTTVTPVGAQVLFRRMRTYAGNVDALATQHAIHEQLRSDVALREALQRNLLPLQDDGNGRIAGFILGELPPPLKRRGLLRACAVLSVAALACVIALSWSVWIWVAVLCVNAAIIARTGGSVQRDTETLTGCLRLLKVANDLAAMHGHGPSLPQLAALAAERANRATFRRAFRWLAFLKMPWLDPVTRILNFAFLVELRAHVSAMRKFARLRHKLAASFHCVGEVDADIAMASWLAYRPDHCQPMIVDRPLLDIRDGCHPLLTDGVANSIRLNGRSVLVTGSNMAGKTTFIKMLAINAVLGQTLGFCLASQATLPRSRVMASIQAAHSVASGKSHYFSEVQTIRAFLAQQARGGCTIFAIDELFSGTNTVERVAIARAVLEALGRHSLVLATTHDVELQACLEDHYDLCHFQEDPAVDGFFDYRLRAGPATERNAIRLLAEVGFPETVVTTAMTYAKQALRSEVGDNAHAAARLH